MATAKDPVCAMVIEETDAVGTSEYNGKTYYFCSMDCKEEFDENPEDYAD
jgi:YHS domain-containing protein